MKSRFLDLLNVDKNQKKKKEAERIAHILEKYMDVYSKEMGKDVVKIKLKYVTHTDKEILFLVDNNLVMVNQPNYKDLYNNMSYLCKLNILDNNVLSYDNYLKEDNYSLISAKNNKNGYILNKNLELKSVMDDNILSLNKELKDYVYKTYIAKLISLYDFNKNRGLNDFKMNDFMMDIDFYKDDDYLNKLHLINARELIECTYTEYLDNIYDSFKDITNKSNIIDGMDEGKKLVKKVK